MPCLLQLALHHVLRGDAGVVGARHPQRRVARHAVVAGQHVLDAAGDGVAQVQRAGDVGRRHGDDEGLAAGVGQPAGELLLRAEVALLLPPFVERLLHFAGVVGFGHGCMSAFLVLHEKYGWKEQLYQDVSAIRTEVQRCGGISEKEVNDAILRYRAELVTDLD
jgi:hypothetical protein